MLMSCPTLMNSPCSDEIARSMRRALRRCFLRVSSSIAAGERKRAWKLQREVAQHHAEGDEVGDARSASSPRGGRAAPRATSGAAPSAVATTASSRSAFIGDRV